MKTTAWKLTDVVWSDTGVVTIAGVEAFVLSKTSVVTADGMHHILSRSDRPGRRLNAVYETTRAHFLPLLLPSGRFVEFN
ncbi:hypothetical protein QYE76_067839 [Lolium multiflorum]|uniref:Uncharacterized protein n=1 Tax=Lolium multiflorum TaxID=4521 RepID=A0AAD8SE35_LOLMU|nr:hypothetical protein QYE76_067839 [Lolium multiflorum]